MTLDNEPPATATAEQQDAREDFYTRQSRLQMQARVALAQAKDLARMEMEVSEKIELQLNLIECSYIRQKTKARVHAAIYFEVEIRRAI